MWVHSHGTIVIPFKLVISFLYNIFQFLSFFFFYLHAPIVCCFSSTLGLRVGALSPIYW